jgi:hypothetical protein
MLQTSLRLCAANERPNALHQEVHQDHEVFVSSENLKFFVVFVPCVVNAL